MRPIKFRYVYKDLDGGIVIYYFTLKQIEAWNVWETLDCCWSHSYELLGIDQFTWLFDKNGKEIYEGDIIRMTHDGLRTFVCVYEKWWFQFQDLVYSTVCSNAGSYYPKYLEIVGNIYETPELLNA